MNPTTNVYATVAYLNKRFERGSDELSEFRDPYTEESVTVTGNVQKEMPFRNMYVSVGGSYSHLQGLVDTEPDFIAAIGLADHLSPTRANGLHAMLNAIKNHAQSLV